MKKTTLVFMINLFIVFNLQVGEVHSATIQYGANYHRATLDFSLVWIEHFKNKGYEDVHYFESEEASIFEGAGLRYSAPWGAVPYGPDDEPEPIAAWYDTWTEGSPFHYSSVSMRPDDSWPMPNVIDGGAKSEIYMEFKVLSEDIDVYASGITITNVDTGELLTGNVSLMEGTNYKMEGTVFAPGDSDERFEIYVDNFYSGNTFIPVPVPAPGAIWLIGSGLVGLIGLKLKSHLIGRESS